MSPQTRTGSTPDRLWIDVRQEAEVVRWAHSFGVTPEELRLAVLEAGARADQVQLHLTGIPAIWH